MPHGSKTPRPTGRLETLAQETYEVDAPQRVFIVSTSDIRQTVREILAHGLPSVEIRLFCTVEEASLRLALEAPLCVVCPCLSKEATETLLKAIDASDTLASVVLLAMASRFGDTAQLTGDPSISLIGWPTAPSELCHVVRRAVSVALRAREATESRERLQARFDPLSRREAEVLSLIVEGHSSKAIARLLSISKRTVDDHRAHILRKTGATSVVTLTRDLGRLAVCAHAEALLLRDSRRIVHPMGLDIARTVSSFLPAPPRDAGTPN